MGKAHVAFAQFALHAKLHQQLDELDARVARDVERIEAAEIQAYDNTPEFGRLEALKREILGIRFVEKK